MEALILSTASAYRLADDHRGHREAVAETFAERDHVRHHVPVLHAQPLAGAAHAGEHFVGHEQNAPLIAERAELGEEVVRRHDRAGPALDRLEHEGRDLAGGASAMNAS